ncbi:Na-translocating system protein MpsC family protein [Paenibacillus tuaregi]|uniref:Na-translocating system protein MpsC family protein n=1 Tax=Paenibacillus tuaregi TaxID=1816681 RepID=UPI000837BB9F|nr:Na-translocating system protein MpsC family protein [Paenibacillus tuaregi]
MTVKEKSTLIASYTGKLLRNRFGKGPESVNVSVDSHGIAIHIRNFISPVEQFLLDKQEEQALRYTRELLMKSLLPELSAYLKNELTLEVQEMYYDWGLHNATGMIVGLFERHTEKSESYPGQKSVHDHVIQVSGKVQKEPVHIDSWWMGPKTLIVVREGILILIEKEFIDMGYEHILKSTKRKLEKRYLEQNIGFEQALGKKISDFYVDWDFSNDRSVILYTFK